MNGLLLVRIHLVGNFLIGVATTLGSVLRPLQGSLDFVIDLSDHRFKLLNQFILVLSFVARLIGISLKLLFQVIIVALFARTNVSFRVRK